MNRLHLQKAITLNDFNRSIRSYQSRYLQVKLFSAERSMFIFCIFVIPNNGAVSFFNIGAINIFTVFLHDLFEYLKPVFVENLK